MAKNDIYTASELLADVNKSIEETIEPVGFDDWLRTVLLPKFKAASVYAPVHDVIIGKFEMPISWYDDQKAILLAFQRRGFTVASPSSLHETDGEVVWEISIQPRFAASQVICVPNQARLPEFDI